MEQPQIINANITLIRVAMAHQFTQEVTAFTEENISGEYELIRINNKKDYREHHIFSNDHGIDLFLDAHEFSKLSKGENIRVGRHNV